MPHPWRCSRPGWMRPWATCSSGWCPRPWQGLGTGWSLRSLPTRPILWFPLPRHTEGFTTGTHLNPAGCLCTRWLPSHMCSRRGVPHSPASRAQTHCWKDEIHRCPAATNSVSLLLKQVIIKKTWKLSPGQPGHNTEALILMQLIFFRSLQHYRYCI